MGWNVSGLVVFQNKHRDKSTKAFNESHDGIIIWRDKYKLSLYIKYYLLVVFRGVDISFSNQQNDAA